MLEGGGYEVIDLGVNVTPEQFVAAVKEKGANRGHVRTADHDHARDEDTNGGRSSRPGSANR